MNINEKSATPVFQLQPTSALLQWRGSSGSSNMTALDFRFCTPNLLASVSWLSCISAFIKLPERGELLLQGIRAEAQQGTRLRDGCFPLAAITRPGQQPASHASSSQQAWSTGTANWIPGQTLQDGRYITVRPLHAGRFSVLWLAQDTQAKSSANHTVVLKVASLGGTYEDHARAAHEVRITQTAQPASNFGDTGASSPKDGLHKAPIIKLLDTFNYIGGQGKQQVMVLEQLGSSLGDVMAAFGGGLHLGLPFPAVKAITLQVAHALHYLHNERGLAHVDIHPDNILLTAPFISRFPALSAWDILRHQVHTNWCQTLGRPLPDPPLRQVPEGFISEDNLHQAQVKLVDFGSACNTTDMGDAKARRALGPSWADPAYYPPEEILALPANPSYDNWQLACLAYWLATGDDLFKPEDDPDRGLDASEAQLGQMIATLGRLPPHLIEASPLRSAWFKPSGRLIAEARANATIAVVPLKTRLVEDHQFDEQEAKELADFVRPLLVYDPAERATSREVLSHQFLQSMSKAGGKQHSEEEAQ